MPGTVLQDRLYCNDLRKMMLPFGGGGAFHACHTYCSKPYRTILLSMGSLDLGRSGQEKAGWRSPVPRIILVLWPCGMPFPPSLPPPAFCFVFLLLLLSYISPPPVTAVPDGPFGRDVTEVSSKSPKLSSDPFAYHVRSSERSRLDYWIGEKQANRGCRTQL